MKDKLKSILNVGTDLFVFGGKDSEAKVNRVEIWTFQKEIEIN